MSRSPAVQQCSRWLHIDDNPGDADLVRILLGEVHPEIHLTHLSTGQAALQFLKREDGPTRAEIPDLILLDLRLIDMEGPDLLRAIRTLPHCQHTPVVILAGTTHDSTMQHCYDLGASKFVIKPFSLEKYKTVLRDIAERWPPSTKHGDQKQSNSAL
jgi:CheY-like chemotaxis protein